MDRAEREFQNYEFVNAIASYEAIAKKGTSNKEVYINLGDANYSIARYAEAAKWYAKLSSITDGIYEPLYYYNYAQSLKSIGNYEKSNALMQRYAKTAKNDIRASNFKEHQDYLNEIDRISGRYSIQHLDINTPYADFAPFIKGTELVFSSARDTGTTLKKIHEWNKRPFSNLFKGEIVENGSVRNVSKYPESLNSFAHESSATFTEDGRVVYFTRNNKINHRSKKNRTEIGHLELVRSEFINGEWTKPQTLPFNSDSYSVANAALNRDGTQLYFSSDMPGSYGQSDLFVVDIYCDGSFGTPRNLGPEINTEGRETFPFIDTDGTLYFASDGRPGLGGLDIFASQTINGKVMVKNLGRPINSDQDDFSFNIHPKNRNGYFASNRKGGRGEDDIYAFVENEPIPFGCSLNVSGHAINAQDGSLIADATIDVFNKQGNIMGRARTNGNGEFYLQLNCRHTEAFRFTGSKEGFVEKDIEVGLANSPNVSGIAIRLRPMEKVAIKGTDLAIFLQLAPIYFDIDKANIRPDAQLELNKIVTYMNRFPQIKIAIRSHTDSDGSDRYNLKLSERRANSTRTYLIEKGIDPLRITAQGFGERQLVNQCTNGVPCSKSQHEENRRSEFIIVQ